MDKTTTSGADSSMPAPSLNYNITSDVQHDDLMEMFDEELEDVRKDKLILDLIKANQQYQGSKYNSEEEDFQDFE